MDVFPRSLLRTLDQVQGLKSYKLKGRILYGILFLKTYIHSQRIHPSHMPTRSDPRRDAESFFALRIALPSLKKKKNDYRQLSEKGRDGKC